MIDVDLLFAFTTGMVVTVNPCGFAMLPAYLSFFVGAEGDHGAKEGPSTTISRALVVSLAVTVGFVATFGVVGLVVNQLTQDVYDVAPWVSLAIGAALVVFGVALLAGWSPAFFSPHLDKGGRTRSIGSMALFGLSYAVASIGCALPIFLAYMVGNFGKGLASGAAFFAAYAAGFWLVIAGLTVTLGLGQRSLAVGLRRVLPYVNRFAGALLVLTGAYIAWYGRIEIGGSAAAQDDAITGAVTDWSADAAQWINNNPELLALMLGAVVVAAMGAALLRRHTAAGE